MGTIIHYSEMGTKRSTCKYDIHDNRHNHYSIFSFLVFSEMRSLILAENLYSSGKLAVLLYLLTRLGGLANTLSLISLGWVAAFVLPKVF